MQGFIIRQVLKNGYGLKHGAFAIIKSNELHLEARGFCRITGWNDGDIWNVTIRKTATPFKLELK